MPAFSHELLLVTAILAMLAGTAQADEWAKECLVNGIVLSVDHFYSHGAQATELDLTDVVIGCPSGSVHIGDPHYRIFLAGAVRCLPGDTAAFTAVITDEMALAQNSIHCEEQ